MDEPQWCALADFKSMNTQAEDMIELLRAADWFSAVGQKKETSVVYVDNWLEADTRCADDDWKLALLRTSNMISAGLARDYPNKKFPKNEIVGNIKQMMSPLIETRVKPLVEQYGLSKAIYDTVDWSITSIVLATHFGNLYLSAFYADLACWYVKGHFPCGWKGDYPEGQLIVY